MFDWISCRGNYTAHINTVFRLAEVLLNRVIFNKGSQLYLVLKNEYDQKMFDWISCRGNYAVQKTVLRLAEVLLNRVISNKRSKLYLVLKNEYDQKMSEWISRRENHEVFIKLLFVSLYS